MATAVFFHAHPDDECISTGGTIARAVGAGHRVVLVTATDGAVGQVAPGTLEPGESLAERRAAELAAAAELLGVHRVEMLGFRDSGMAGTETNDHPASFWRTDLEDAAGRLAGILREEGAELLTVYDEHGTYGHPDHVQVHRVGVRAAELAGVGHVFEATVHRPHVLSLFEVSATLGVADEADGAAVEEMRREVEDGSLGVPGEVITHAVDVSAHAEVKRAALAAHRSQVPADSFFLSLPAEMFTLAFGTEWFIERGHHDPGEPYAPDIFAALGGS